MNETKTYLGDAVYVEVEDNMFKLTTGNGIITTNTICLEPEVYDAFKRYAENAFKKYASNNEVETDE